MCHGNRIGGIKLAGRLRSECSTRPHGRHLSASDRIRTPSIPRMGDPEDLEIERKIDIEPGVHVVVPSESLTPPAAHCAAAIPATVRRAAWGPEKRGHPGRKRSWAASGVPAILTLRRHGVEKLLTSSTCSFPDPHEFAKSLMKRPAAVQAPGGRTGLAQQSRFSRSLCRQANWCQYGRDAGLNHWRTDALASGSCAQRA